MSQLTKFSSQADSEILNTMKKIAKQEGRQLQILLDEAMRDYIEKKRSGKPRRHVLEAFDDSLKNFDPLYDLLAK